MTDAPTTRKTHVVRRVGTNKNRDVLQDIYLDIERMDIVKSVTQTTDSPNFQGHQQKFRWADDPSADDYDPDGLPSQLFDIVKVCDPSEPDLDDPEEWIPVEVRKSSKSTGGGQGVQDRYRNNDDDSDPAETTRVVNTRRISHYDTNIDDAAQAAFDADPGLTAYVVSGDEYQRDDSTKDETQYVEHEVITSLKHGTNQQSESDGGTDTGRQTRLLNQYLIDQSDEAQLNEMGSSGINPPYRLDPYQNIINVQLSRDLIVVFVDIIATDTPDFHSSFNPTGVAGKENAEFLQGFIVNDSPCVAYKVSTGAGEFMNTIAIPSDPDPAAFPCGMNVYVFAGSLDQAMEGTALALNAYILETTTEAPPAKADPPGLIWSIGLPTHPSGTAFTWKIRLGKHRGDTESTPPNNMVQVYPMPNPWVWQGTSFSGYQIRTYRLDRKGTETSYGILHPAPGDSNPGAGMDPAWHQSISDNPFFKGIPFGDPPPLISSDNPSI